MTTANHLFSWTSIFLLVLFAYCGIADQRVSENQLESEGPNDFSIDRVMGHLQVISDDIHYIGSPYHREVQSYLVSELEALGLNVEVQRQRIFRIREDHTQGTHVENVIARIKGTGTGKSLLVMSHYDAAAPHSYGASDAGSGVATILEAARVFTHQNEQPTNDIIFLFTDAEEAGMLGARAFIEHHPLSKNVGLALNFEARGSGGPSYMLMETDGKNGKLLEEFTKANPQAINANSLVYSIYKLMPNNTDSTPLREIAGIKSFLFAYLDDFFDYHTAQDTWQRIDRSSLAHQADYLMKCMNHFAFSDLKNLEAEDDHVFINLPFIKLLRYPYSWNLPLLIIGFLLFIGLVAAGIKRKQINLKNSLRGFIPFFVTLLGNCLLTFGLWQLILIIHPGYKDILHGFPYNGYYYLGGFMALNVSLAFVIYRKWISKHQWRDLIVAPLLFWLIINLLMVLFLPGGSFLIIPAYLTLAMLALS
ncbi:MAG: M20/M25/M40 family metallo-hydrolase, partial [Bacteroidota bacterium]